MEECRKIMRQFVEDNEIEVEQPAKAE